MFYLKGTALFLVGLATYLGFTMGQERKGGKFDFNDYTFASSVYNVLKKNDGNVFFSPYSLQVALAMVYSGAGGNTAQQLKQNARFSENKEEVYGAVKNSMGVLQKAANVTLNVANGIFVHKDFTVKESFSKNIVSVFNAETKQLDFGDSKKSAQEINSFVSTRTNGKIPELFGENSFNSLTRLVLVNAVYFKGKWVFPFDPAATTKGDFFLNSKDKVEVDFMRIKKRFNVGENPELKATVLELPYKGDVSMVLIVPKEIEGIKHVQEKLKDFDLSKLTEQTFSNEVELTMPKFKMEQSMDLNDPLRELGITDMFDSGKADFSGITSQEQLYVSKAIQKAYIDVNEEGTEAAAATACNIRTKRSMDFFETVVIDVDRPFIFFIKSQDLMMFAGCFRTPHNISEASIEEPVDLKVPPVKEPMHPQKRSSSKWYSFGDKNKCSIY